MLRWRRCLVVFGRLLDGVGVALVACRIEQAPAFAGRRRPFATEHRFAILELGRRIRIRWGARRLGTVHLLLVVQFLLVLGFQCLNCGSVLRFQFVQVRPRPGDRLGKGRELAGQFPIQFLGLARDRERRGERRILI